MTKKQTLAQEFKEASKKALEELSKLPKEEQKKVKHAQRNLKRKWGEVPYY